MINVSILRYEDQGIHGFEVKGHAYFAKAGEDIVCAGVSAVTVGTVNSVESLTGIVMDSKMKNGFLNASLPLVGQPKAQEQAQLLLASMVVMLQSIELSYGEYIQIQDIII
ncbi:hypothetical protein D3C77_305390 [compost metagenome]